MTDASQFHYVPESPPLDTEVTEWIRRELQKISDAFEAPDVPILYLEPTKPRDGQLVRADGVEWNPGSGRGLYIFDEALWKLVVAL